MEVFSYMSYENDNQVLPTLTERKPDRDKDRCKQQPGTILRIFIPAGAEINLLNLIEISSPSGICIIIRIPLLAGLIDNDGKTLSLADIQNAITSVGGKVEVMA
jgi:hypothetical protein